MLYCSVCNVQWNDNEGKPSWATQTARANLRTCMSALATACRSSWMLVQKAVGCFTAVLQTAAISLPQCNLKRS